MAGPEVRVVITPPDLLKRMAAYPRRMDKTMRLTMTAALLVLQEKTPRYPTRQSSYKRTGGLGRSLGVSQQASRLGDADIWVVRPMGGGHYRGEYGTRLEYAKWVIGERTQAWMHRGIWWTMRTVVQRGERKVIEVFEKAAESMARFLDGQG
jgi:hypothetical protein